LYFDIELDFTNRGFVKYNSIFHQTRFNRQTEKVVENLLRKKKLQETTSHNKQFHAMAGASRPKFCVYLQAGSSSKRQ